MNRLVGLLIVLAVLGIACSHHSSDAGSPDNAYSPVSAIQDSKWGVKVCRDFCGCLPPKEIRVASWRDVQDNDLCGLPWSCEYRCTADCSCCQKADLNGSGRVDGYDLALANPGQLAAVRECFGFSCGA